MMRLRLRRLHLNQNQPNNYQIDPLPISLTVDSLEHTVDFLSAIGLEVKSYQETKRERWHFGDVDVAIDTWPWIPPFVELEGDSEERLKMAAFALGLDWERTLHGSVEIAYQAYYDVTEAEINSLAFVTFTPVPDWLVARRR